MVKAWLVNKAQNVEAKIKTKGNFTFINYFDDFININTV